MVNKIIGGVLALSILGIAGYALLNKTETIEVVNVQEVATSTVEVNNISEAQKQLNEAKRLLEEEEDKILAEIKERETRLEEIRAVRLSFTEAPAQAN